MVAGMSGVPRVPNICMAPRVQRCIHSRSAVMPFFVTLLLSKWHHTRGLVAECACNSAACCWAKRDPGAKSNARLR